MIIFENLNKNEGEVLKNNSKNFKEIKILGKFLKNWKKFNDNVKIFLEKFLKYFVENFV